MLHFMRRTGLFRGRVVMVTACGAAAIGLGSMLAASGTDAPNTSKSSPSKMNASGSGTEAPAAAPAAGPLSLADQVNQTFRLRGSEVISLQLDPTPDIPINTQITIDGQVHQLSLLPRSVRAVGYQLLAQVADGSKVNVDPGPMRTLRGSLADVPGTDAAASLLEDGLHGVIRMPDGTRWWFEPIASRVPGAAPDQHVLYRGTDAIPSGGTCGVNDADMKLPDVEPGVPEGDGGIAGGLIHCAQLGVDADFEYYTGHGSNVTSVENQINLVINTVNVQYENEVDIRHEITTIIVRTAEPDPYTATDPDTLLNQMQSEWNSNESGVQRDVAHLFTGKNIDGSVIGIAHLSVICVLGSAYSLVQSDCCGGLSCQSDLSAHELGHTWSATHCTCPSNTMNPSLTCANVHAPASITQIINFRNSRTCLNICEDGFTTVPFFDDFPTTTIDATKWTGVDGAQSNTTGTNEPSAPNSCNLDGSTIGGDQIRSAFINTTAMSFLTLNYMYERKGGGDQPETGDDLVVEYINADGVWTEIQRQFGNGPAMTNYAAATTINFPADAMHSDFRFRFRVISSQNGLDDWFVDNVNLIGLAPPPNNNCANTIITTAGSYPFTTIGATTDGPTEPLCNLNGNNNITNDIWFFFPAQCLGTATISLCGADYNSKLAVYGPPCPGTTSGTAIACSDNDCGDDAQVTFPVTIGQIFRVRVGGFNGATGSGTMVITCNPTPPACPADVNGDSVVNAGDMLAVINAWGPCTGCPADVNDDGAVNSGDLLAVINGWGACP